MAGASPPSVNRNSKTSCLFERFLGSRTIFFIITFFERKIEIVFCVFNSLLTQVNYLFSAPFDGRSIYTSLSRFMIQLHLKIFKILATKNRFLFWDDSKKINERKSHKAWGEMFYFVIRWITFCHLLVVPMDYRPIEREVFKTLKLVII